mmetsp:Transcript_4270/g.5004  ORF Transcript_4270/g.5004 Transcript_4270/m.5004 type:complete len:103 (+) Transcript_4270:220-528(+)
MAHQILEEQDKAKEMINEHVRVFDKLVQEVHKQVLNINDEVEQHNLVLDDLETAVNIGQGKISIQSKKAQMLAKQNSNFCKLYCVIFILTAILVALIANKAL